MSYHDHEEDDMVETNGGGPTGDRLRYDEGQAVADRLDQLDDPDEKEDFDEVLAEFDERFDSEE